MKRLIRIQRIVIIISSVMMLLKVVAYYLTGSNAILSDTLESVINIVAGIIALLSLIYASKPQDRDHPYGHGKIEYISAGLEGSLITIAGLVIISKACYNFIYPQEISTIDVGIYLVAVAGVADYIMGRVLISEGKKNNSLVVEADGRHILADAYSTMGMILGLVLVYFTNMVWIDNTLATMFGLLIIKTGIKILRKSYAGIMDEADMNLLKETISVVEKNRKPEWIDMHKMRIIKFGTKFHVDFHLTLPWYFSTRQSHEEQEKVEQHIRHHFKDKADVTIHIDPCEDFSCVICQMENCAERNHEMKKKLDWTLDNVLNSHKHHIE